MNQTVLSQELVLEYELWKVLQEIVPYEFLSFTPHLTEKFFSPKQVFNPAVSLI